MHELKNEIEKLGNDELELNQSIDKNIEKGNLTDQNISNAVTYIDQLEKQCVSKKKELEGLNSKKIPIVESAEEEKTGLTKEYENKLKALEEEKQLKIAEAERTKTITISTFFKKEMVNF